MGFSFCTTFYAQGISGHPVVVEADIQQGLPKCTIVGLADAAVQEARDRVRSAIKNQGFSFPRHAITINLAPSTERKTGAVFDLAIALSMLAADTSIPQPPQTTAYFGELTLSGQIRPVKNIYILVQAAQSAGITECVVAPENGPEASVVEGIIVRTASTLKEICLALQGNYPLPRAKQALPIHTQTHTETWDAIRGQVRAKKALILAAISEEHVLLVGSPGCGKTTLAHAIGDILPPLTISEAREVTAITSSIAQPGTLQHLQQVRPFRNPHHTASMVSLIGGGTPLRPGEISLAHRGVLFLDEFSEFSQEARESLREPMEEGHITVARASGTTTFPAKTTVIAAMNPCACGYKTHPRIECSCTGAALQSYTKRLSGPLLSRFGLTVRVEDEEESIQEQQEGSSIRQSCAEARQKFEEEKSGRKQATKWTVDAQKYWNKHQKAKHWSGREQRQIKNIALANALYEKRTQIEERDLAIALSYRPLSGGN